MAWEARRNGKRYFYRKRREGGRVVSEYDHPLVAAILEPLRIADGELERCRRAAWRLECGEMADADRALDEYLDRTREVAETALEAAGYHSHRRGAWRRRRHGA